MDWSNRWWPIGCHESLRSMTNSDFREANKIRLTSVSILLAQATIWPSDADLDDVTHIYSYISTLISKYQHFNKVWIQLLLCSVFTLSSSRKFNYFFDSTPNRGRTFFVNGYMKISVSIFQEKQEWQNSTSNLRKTKHWTLVYIRQEKSLLFINFDTQSSLNQTILLMFFIRSALWTSACIKMHRCCFIKAYFPHPQILSNSRMASLLG